MNKFEFFKNNIKHKISSDDNLIFLDKDLKIIKENAENIITLDFIKKECLFKLKNTNIALSIPTIEMNYIIDNNNIILTYILTSEPEVKNTIKVIKEDA